MSSTRTTTRSRSRRIYPRPIPPDPIDILDTTGLGGVYHHSGPYDATLLSRNLNPKTSPLAAVRDSNCAAIAATPREFVADSLAKRVPLQGTSTVPPGGRDFGGGVMEYEDGADLMREERAEGGPYKRWPGISYHPDDLKGKGEPSYSLEEAEKVRLRKLGTTSSGTGSSHELRPYPTSPRRHNGRRSAGDVSRHTGSSARPEAPKGLRRRLGDLKNKGS